MPFCSQNATELTGYPGFTTSAGHVGPHFRVDHDISMLAPEIWCRMRVHERDPRFLIENGFLEKLTDFEFGGRIVLASRLGYRITSLFVDRFLGRIFETPNAAFPEEILQPERQDPGLFAAGMRAVVEARRCVARNYFEEGSVEAACPPLKALLHIMVHGVWEGKSINDPCVRGLFTREAVLSSDWYRERLCVKQERDVALWRRHLASLDSFRGSGIDVERRLACARWEFARVSSPAYLNELFGTIGADPFYGQIEAEKRETDSSVPSFQPIWRQEQ